MTKISQADPPALDPSSCLLHVGKAGKEVQLLLGFGLGQETILFFTIFESFNPTESGHLRCKEETSKLAIVDPTQGTGCTRTCGCVKVLSGGGVLRPTGSGVLRPTGSGVLNPRVRGLRLPSSLF